MHSGTQWDNLEQCTIYSLQVGNKKKRIQKEQRDVIRYAECEAYRAVALYNVIKDAEDKKKKTKYVDFLRDRGDVLKIYFKAANYRTAHKQDKMNTAVRTLMVKFSVLRDVGIEDLYTGCFRRNSKYFRRL
jgi:hypothetical protein